MLSRKPLWGNQCVQIGRLIALWATFQSLWNIILPTFLGNFCLGVKIFYFWATFIHIWQLFTGHTEGNNHEWKCHKSGTIKKPKETSSSWLFLNHFIKWICMQRIQKLLVHIREIRKLCRRNFPAKNTASFRRQYKDLL